MKKIVMFAVLLCSQLSIGCDNSASKENHKLALKESRPEEISWSKWSARDYITIDGQRVYIGMTSDASVKILNPNGLKPYMRADPTVVRLTNSLRVIHHEQFRNGDIQVDITYERTVNPGPYRITKIMRRQKTTKAASYSKKAKEENQKQVKLNNTRQNQHKSRCARLVKLSQNREALKQMSLKELEKLYIDLSNCE